MFGGSKVEAMLASVAGLGGKAHRFLLLEGGGLSRRETSAISSREANRNIDSSDSMSGLGVAGWGFDGWIPVALKRYESNASLQQSHIDRRQPCDRKMPGNRDRDLAKRNASKV